MTYEEQNCLTLLRENPDDFTLNCPNELELFIWEAYASKGLIKAISLYDENTYIITL